jgi:hypothetical protein
MFKSISVKNEGLFHFFQRFGEHLARKTLNQYIFKGIFDSLISFSSHPFRLRSPSTEWCEIWYTAGDCYFPYGQGQCSNCRSDSPCPSGYHVSFAYNYTTTGCWCIAKSQSTRVCCDCTPAWNNPYVRHGLDCQCPHTIFLD